MGKIIEAKNVIKEYGSFKNPFQALKGINLDIEEGEFLAIMGPSGSGKTTLLNLLATIDQATRGKIYIDGKYIRSYTEKQLSLLRREYISFIFQDCNLLDNLTIRDNITSPLIIMGAEKEECDKRVESVSKRLGINTILDKYPSECSGGQKQRVAACRALITNPKIIVADEPTGALDTKNSDELLSILRKLNEEDNITIVMVTHDPYIASFSSRVIMIRDGLLDTTIENKDHNQTRFYNSILKESARQTIFKDEESALSIDDYEELLNENKRLKKRIIELEYKEKLNSI